MNAPTVSSLEPPRHLDFRSALQFYLIDCTTLPGKLIDILLVCLNLAVCAILVVETYPVSPALRNLMWQAEIIIVAIFIVEYIARLYGARDRVKQMRDIYSILFYEVEHPVNAGVSTFTDAFYFTVVALTTVGFGDITPLSEGGKWVTILMILSGIILIPWQISRIVKAWIHFGRKEDIVCPQCGLRYHDNDASHCKSCGHVIYQEYDGG